MSTSVFSIHNGNILPEVLRLQEACVRKFLPSGWFFTQLFQPFGGEPHAEGMKRCMELCKTDVIMFLDCDCIPLSVDSFVLLFHYASQGVLAGNIQRSNHLQNNAHVFVAPSGMAFSKEKYARLGSPSFHTTQRGDIGEELTYRWEENAENVIFFRPTESRDEIWDLEPGARGYGHGTIFANIFYHEFQIRTGGSLEKFFIEKCKKVLGGAQ